MDWQRRQGQQVRLKHPDSLKLLLIGRLPSFYAVSPHPLSRPQQYFLRLHESRLFS